MVKKRRYKKRSTYKKKRGTYGRKKRYGNQRVAMYRGIGYLPQKYICCMQYHDFATFITIVDGFLVLQYFINNLINPGATTPPRDAEGFEDILKIYNQWRVTGINWKITSNNLDDASPHTLSVLPRQDALGFTSDALLNEQPYAKSKMCGLPGGNKSQVSLSGTVNFDGLAGRKLRYEDEGRYGGIGSSEPTQPIMLNVLWRNIGTTVSADMNVAFHTHISFNVEWWDLDVNSGSP